MTSENMDLALEIKRPEQPTTEDMECIICHEQLNKKSQIDSCTHVFCFVCIKKWSRSACSRKIANCPVCGKQFYTIKHTTVLDEDIEYTVPRVSEIPNWMIHTIKSFDSFGWYIVKKQYIEQFSCYEEFTKHPVRKRIYKENKWAIPLTDSRRYSDFDIVFFSDNREQLLPLLFKFILRDIVVIRSLLKPYRNEVDEIENYNYDKFTVFIIKTVLGLVDIFEIRSPSMVNTLRHHLNEYTDHFCHELFNFANSLVHISKLCSYDELVQYSSHRSHKLQNMTSKNVESKLKIMHPLWPQKPVKVCLICLQTAKNKCRINSCAHLFCFVCIKELSKEMDIPKCPVCKMEFNIITYVSTLFDIIQYTIQPRGKRLSIHNIKVCNAFGWHSVMTKSMIGYNYPKLIAGENKRMSVYKNNLSADPLYESSNFFNTALYSDKHEQLYPLLYQFIRRDIMAIRAFKKPRGRDVFDIIELYYFEQYTDFIIDTVLVLVSIFEIKSENMANALRHHLFEHTNHFALELYNFANSLNTVKDMFAYDALVQYKR